MMNDTIEIINLVPKFLDFYNKSVDCDEETRFDLWKKHYAFAAVPPGEDGERLVKQQLAASWERYGTVITFLEQWDPKMEQMQEYLFKVKEALAYDDAVDVALIFFVGGFDGNAFAAPYGENRVAVCLPVEAGLDEIVIVHELTHLVHGKIIGSTMSYEKTVASLVFQEGLATQLSKYLVPGQKDEAYIEHQEGWLQECYKDAEQIVQGIKPYLQECSGEVIYRFTMGTGTTGKVREGYFAGWILIGDMLLDGWSFAEIARVAEEDMARVLNAHRS